MESSSLFRRYNLLSTASGQREMHETLTSTILPEGLSRHINPFHLGAWLSLHFGKGGYYVSARFIEGAFDADGKPRGSYEIWAPTKISEVSMFPEVRREAPSNSFHDVNSYIACRKTCSHYLTFKSARRENLLRNLRNSWNETMSDIRQYVGLEKSARQTQGVNIVRARHLRQPGVHGYFQGSRRSSCVMEHMVSM